MSAPSEQSAALKSQMMALLVVSSLFNIVMTSDIETRYSGGKVKAFAGSTFTFNWTYVVTVPIDSKPEAITWGLGLQGNSVKEPFLTVEQSGSQVTNAAPPKYKDRVKWTGNWSKQEASFSLSDVTRDDKAVYSIRITFDGFTSKTDSVELEVQDLQESTLSPTVQVVKENTTATFICTSNGVPDPVISWYRLWNSLEEHLKTENEVHIVRSGNSSTLTIEPADYRYHGMSLMCRANNVAGETNTTGTLAVEYFRPLPEPGVIIFRAKIKEKVALACPVFGFPRPAIEWHYPNKSPTKDLFTNILSFTVQKESDFGEYYCSAGDEKFKFMVEKSAARPTCSNCISELAFILTVILAITL